MKKLLFVLVLLLLIVACKPKNELQAVVLEDGQDSIPAKTTRADTGTRVDSEEERPEEFEDITEIKTYNAKSECNLDTKGVVRHFDESGKKTVYRNECGFGFIVSYACEGNEVTSETKECRGTCTSGPYGDTCE